MTETDGRTVQIERVSEPAELFRHYPGQSQEQPCYLGLDLESGRLFCAYNPELGPPYPTPMAIHLGRIRGVAIPCLTADAANRLMEEVKRLAQQVLDGSSIEVDELTLNTVGLLDEDASEAWGGLCDWVSSFCEDPDAETVEGVDAADWYAGDATLPATLGLGAATADEQLDEMARDVEDWMRSDCEGVVVPLGVREHLDRLRAEARALASA
ncbi:hypothetical protein [Micromonospora maritima]|uniref:hypothetical protein n=1 Tax=Micromonospora maritima TaxID=986711 RepID=UPI00157C9EC7|nr:hypothetical protein [Micromonospora maritima]